MKFAYKVLLLIVLIIIGKWEKENQSILNPGPRSVYSPVYSQNMQPNENPKILPGQEIQKLSVNYNNY